MHIFSQATLKKRGLSPGLVAAARPGVELGWAGVAGWDMSTVWSRPLAEALAARPLPATQGYGVTP